MRPLLLALCASAALAAPPLEPLPKQVLDAKFQLSGSTDAGSVEGIRKILHAWEARYGDEEKAKRAALLKNGGIESEEGVDLLESMLWSLRVRAYPDDRVDWARISKAAEDREKRSPASWMKGRWEFVGPQNLPVPYRIYFGQGPLNGRANAVAFDPENKRTWYLGAAGGGVWKTLDAGATWKPLTDHWPLMNVSSLVALEGGVVYAGTGDFPYPGLTASMGLMKSTDGGQTWARIGPAELDHFAISEILVDPDDHRIVTIATGRGARQWGQVWRSTDAGQTWTAVIAKQAAWCGLSVSARDRTAKRWYFAVGYDGVGHREVYRSRDRGATWEPVFKAGPVPMFSLCDVACSPKDPDVAYLLLGGLQRIFKTADAGKNWIDITAGHPGGYNWAQDWYDLWLTCSTSPRGDVVYVGLIDVTQKVGGAGWRSVGVTYTPGALAHNDQQNAAVDPSDPNHLLMASDGGAYSFRYDPKKDTWAFTSHNAKLGITQIYRAAWHPTSPDTVLAGTQDNASPCCLGDRLTWKNVGGGDGAYCAINPENPAIQFASSQFLFLYRTDDNWRTTSFLGPETGNDRKAFIAPFALDRANPNVLYAGTNHLWRWNDASRSWTPRLGQARLSAQGALLAVAAQGPRLYTGSSMGELWTSADAGATWTRIDRFPNRAITSIAISPRNPTDIVITLSGILAPHVWRCADTTAPVWQDVSGSGDASVPDAPADGLARDPEDPDRRWYVATDVGVFATRDGGTTWQDATRPLGLPGVHVNDLEIVPGTGYLNAATFGRGLWRVKLR